MNAQEDKPYSDLSYSQSVDIYLEKCWWLTASDQLLVTSLQKIAEALDRRMSASLQAEMTKLIRLLEKSKPQNQDEDDALADFLAGLDK